MLPNKWGYILRNATLILGLLPRYTLADESGAQDWSSQCQGRVLAMWQNASVAVASNATPMPPFPSLVDSSGTINPKLTPNDAWGISVEECFRTCDNIASTFRFDDFSASFTNWLLPWLALVAQLPFETDGPFNDLMSMLIAVGSPALITYSLCITIFNRARVSQRFAQLKNDAKNSLVKRVYYQFIQRMEIACYVLQESQQAPMRAWEGDGWLSSLILLDINQAWWESVHKHLDSTRRGVTTSLVAQVLFAVVAWLFTIIAAFESLGDPETGLSISCSGMWLWMIPVIAGWVGVGSQSDKGTIADALEATAVPCYRAQPADENESQVPKPKPGSQDGIKTMTGMLATPSQVAGDGFRPGPHDEESFRQNLGLEESSHAHSFVPTSRGCRSTETNEKSGHIDHAETLRSDEKQSSPNRLDFCGLDRKESFIFPSLTSPKHHVPHMYSATLTGHEGEEGPIYNYARVFTAARFAETVTYGFERALKAIADGKSPNGKWRRYDGEGKRVDLHENLIGTTEQYARFCGFDQNLELRESYASWSAIPKKVWRHVLVSILVALFVLWGTVGPSILIGMTTPAAGLGCRSGSYVLYGCLATISFLSLVGASFCSHSVMLRYQHGRPLGRILPALFVTLKGVGCFLASINAVWLILSSIFELAGIFDTCFCQSAYIGLKKHGWILLFKTAEDLAASAQTIWVGAIAFGAAVCIVSCVFVWLGIQGTR